MDFSHYIVHVDMDAFYAAVEIRDQPELRKFPVAVGSNSMLVSDGIDYWLRFYLIIFVI